MDDIEALKRENAELRAELTAIKGLPGAVSPLAPTAEISIAPIAGVTMATAATGVRYKGRTDVMLMRLAPGSSIAGVFTTSQTRSAPVLWCERHVRRAADSGKPLAILVNSGNANAFTGGAGEESVRATTAKAAAALGTDPECVFPASTGVIGERLPHEKIEAAIDGLAATLSEDGWADAARAIMTTDTFPKLSQAEATVEGTPVRIAGIAKGSGMIAPDMATMLSYVATDANIGPEALQTILGAQAELSFNAITVDGDTSTSDTLMLAATCQAGHARIEDAADPRLEGFRSALLSVLQDLAHQVVRDGEGASKFIEIRVTGAETDSAAKKIALSIANSPLVKTAFAGEDPNWGRIVMAVGKSGEQADRDALTIRFGDILVAEKGWVAESYREEDGAAYMTGSDLCVSVDVGVGTGEARVWTCDLTYAYVRINADYRS